MYILKLTREELKDKFRECDYSAYKLKDILGCTTKTTIKVLRDNGIEVLPPGTNHRAVEVGKMERSVLERLYIKEGKNIEQLSKKLGVCEAYMRKTLKEKNIKTSYPKNFKGLEKAKEMTKEQLQKLYDSVDNNATKLSKKLKISTPSTTKILRSKGIAVNSPGIKNNS